MTSSLASLGSRFEVSSREKIRKRKKPFSKKFTLSSATTIHVNDAVNRLAIKLKMSRSRAIELAVEELCAKHGIEIERAEDPSDGST